jgi:hypothetical protein
MSGSFGVYPFIVFVRSRYCSVHNISAFHLLVSPKSELYGIRNTHDIKYSGN